MYTTHLLAGGKSDFKPPDVESHARARQEQFQRLPGHTVSADGHLVERQMVLSEVRRYPPEAKVVKHKTCVVAKCAVL